MEQLFNDRVLEVGVGAGKHSDEERELNRAFLGAISNEKQDKQGYDPHHHLSNKNNAGKI